MQPMCLFLAYKHQLLIATIHTTLHTKIIEIYIFPDVSYAGHIY